MGDAGEWDETIRMAAWRQNSMSFFRYLRNQGTWEHHFIFSQRSLMLLEAVSLRTRKWMGKYTKCPLNKLQLGPSSSIFPSHTLPLTHDTPVPSFKSSNSPVLCPSQDLCTCCFLLLKCPSLYYIESRRCQLIFHLLRDTILDHST